MYQFFVNIMKVEIAIGVVGVDAVGAGVLEVPAVNNYAKLSGYYTKL